MTPQPKRNTIRLKGKAYAGFRKKVFYRDRGLCQHCGNWAPLLYDGVFDMFLCGHVSHIKSKGAGGGDTLDNVLWKCFHCHIEIEHIKGA